ncbi:phage tail sheath family protein [Pseudarthrobacter sulfonivorans]|uniref:phage tail sheath family protein n=1 Tax=Pseudarthrobacter sulfonivorans TaxID=121292 RepID=UPI002104A065|nr:phage tail sheath C-terminal domain-containing protein [Pseudarthrobacter sulfonivorans]
MTAGLQLGRPGIYRHAMRPDEPAALDAVRLDETGFVGVALRGPVHTPVLVTSWSGYVRSFGGFERPRGAPNRLLPYAVQAFFAQGGERAWILRVAPPNAPHSSADDATAQFRVGSVDDGGPALAAANEGTWGNGLQIRLGYEVLQSFVSTLDDDGGIRLPAGAALAPWTLVRLRPLAPTAPPLLNWVTGERRTDPRMSGRSAVFESPPNEPAAKSFGVDVVTAVIEVSEAGAAPGSAERLTGLGLRPGHPRFLPKVLDIESTLLRSAGDWTQQSLTPEPLLADARIKRVQDGADRSPEIGYNSFFDDGPADQDPLDEEHHRGVDAMGRESRIGLLCVPDLTWRSFHSPSEPEPLPAPESQDRSNCCDSCSSFLPEAVEPIYAPSGDAAPGLDARSPADLAEILARQRRLVEVAELRHRFVALLDVPEGMSRRQILDWRACFQTSYAAAYYPWLGVPRADGTRTSLVQVPPSSFAAGITADRERRLGLSWGPANAVAAGAVLAAETVTDATHDELHLRGINVYRQERDGFRLSAARTLSTEPEYIQLSVRRLMTMLALTLESQSQWLVFEPNTAQLRDSLQRMVTEFLRVQHRLGAFAGKTEAESFFVRCDDGLNAPQSLGLGRLVAEIGVAPASPLEYLVLRISQDVDGALQASETGQESLRG